MPGDSSTTCGSDTSRRRDFGQRLLQPHAVTADRAYRDAVHQIRKHAPHHVAVFQHVRHAGGRAGIVLQHQKAPFSSRTISTPQTCT